MERERELQSYLYVVAVHVRARGKSRRLPARCGVDVCLSVNSERETVLKLQRE